MGAGTAERSSGLFVSPPLLLLSDRKQTGERTNGKIFAFHAGPCAGIMWDFLSPCMRETPGRLNYPKRE